MRTLSLAITALAATVGTSSIRAQDAMPSNGGAAVQSVPYAWRSVVIKANGFINGIVYGPVERGLAYINTDMGGAYRHDAATGSWVCLTDWIDHADWSLNQMGVETIAVDPTEAGRVYAGVGTYMGPSAVLRSTDQGRTWQRTNVPFPMNGNGSARNSGQRMNVDPNQPSRLLYGTRTMGLWVSDDHAATWNKIDAFPTTGDDTLPGKDTGIVWTLFDKASGSAAGSPTPVAYAGVCTTEAAKVFRTLDAGKTWAAVPNQPGDTLLPTRVAITPDGKTLYLTYVTGTQYPGPHGIDGGTVYRCDNPASDAPVWTEIAPAKAGYGWSGICLDPKAAGTLYVTTICKYNDGGDDVFRSTDRGQTWRPLFVGKHRDDSSAAYAKASGIHWTGDVQVNPLDDNEGMFTTGYGLYRTTNLTADEPSWTFYNEGFEQSAVEELVSPTGGNANLLSAIGDRDGYRHEDLNASPTYGQFGQPSEFGQTQRMMMGTNRDIDVAFDAPNVVVRVGGQPQYSNDGGITWHWLISDAERAVRDGPADGKIAISPKGDRLVWAPRRAAARFSVRDGDGWKPFSEVSGLPHGGNVVADPVQSGTFYARADDRLYISTDGGMTWAVQNDAMPAGGRWLRVVPGHAGHLWTNVGDEHNGSLQHSTDAGKTWIPIQPNVLTVVKQVGVGAAASGSDYPAVFIGGTVGGIRGFFRSDDIGKTWVRVNDDAHQYGNVSVINGDTRVHGRLYVGTNGRGILYADPVK